MKLMNHRLLRPLSACLLLACAMSPAVRAETLQEIFDLAVKNDPEIRQARARFNANHTLLEQGRSFLLPTISATGSVSRDTSGIAETPPAGSRSPEHSFGDGFISKSYGLNLRQALMNFKAWYTYQSAKKGDEAAMLTLQQSEQQLILKVAKAYFDVLRSQANLTSLTTEEQAARQVLEQTRQRFDVGLVAITDVYDSQANADLVSVNKLTEENTFRQRLELLSAITGQPHNDLAKLADDFPIASIEPASVEEWIKLAQENNLAIRIAELDLASKENDAKAARSDYLPTLDLSVNYGWSKSGNPFSFFPALASERSSVAINLTIPIFSGGLASARKNQAYFNRDASREGLLKSQRDNTQSTRNAYRSVETDVRAVAARAQAVKSAQSSNDATRTGAEVGTRNIVDVVLSQRLLFQAQRDYANARLNYVMDTLTLKQAAGVLNPQDVIELTQWLRQ